MGFDLSPHPTFVAFHDYFAPTLINIYVHRFGPGPHKVELEVEYPRSPLLPSDPDPATWKKWTSYLLMEMAPLDLMPHTVNLFLKQVHHQLWDGTYVSVNARHVMQISPRYEDEPANVVSDERRSYHHFHAEGLDKVSYQEYSPEYPHEQYTIGMSGRPSGPDFYINKMDNTVIPGGDRSGATEFGPVSRDHGSDQERKDFAPKRWGRVGGVRSREKMG